VSAGDAAIAVREIGSFHIGGRMIRVDGLPMRDRISTPGGPVHRIDPNGEIIIGQMYVQYVHLLKPQAPSPLLLWHGGGLTGVTWESTPDGRPGWQMFFLRAGFDSHGDVPCRKEGHVQPSVGEVRMPAQMVQGRLEQSDLLQSPDRRDEKDNAGMKIDLPITPTKLECIVGDEHPIALGNDREKLPIGLRPQSQMIDMHGLVTAIAGYLDQS
jgi:hypothetical protein